ncbi:hypothetical protein GGI25_001137 [Coemansia spiralis]|uniref:RNI-like protein n=2 Tax=Coemansia TaxID=4863 RepID=A0A9W8KYS3_9FUNG|nr:hypothetical protein BX070DRAFT_230485 [Coemansia spiralis]KAJ1995570.1 hypothetical protein EDC05_000808 [Coemansia umbellata]KAJ2625098.1 hypothetical protein GGI26_000901 [Coemansia sp. RSA 1358]KAJ2679948.1 hypothetical protein GGI25_001137 [Coemansia spiralis]
MSRPHRRHARKASATTAEEILLPVELMTGLTSNLSQPPNPQNSTVHRLTPDATLQTQEHNTNNSNNDPLTSSTDVPAKAASLPTESAQTTKPTAKISNLDLAPLFPVLEADEHEPGVDAAADASVQAPLDPLSNTSNEGASRSSKDNGVDDLHMLPEKGILKESKSDDSNGSLWSLWPGAKKWFSGSILPGSRSDISAHPTFAKGAGIPAARQSTDEASLLSRTAPSLDFERSTNFVPPLSQERIKSTEFWSNFALELDPSRLKRIRFSMPLIVTEFDPENSRVCDPDESPNTSVETTAYALRSSFQDDFGDIVDMVSPPPTKEGADDDSDNPAETEHVDISGKTSEDAQESVANGGDIKCHLENSLYRIISTSNAAGTASGNGTRRSSGSSASQSSTKENDILAPSHERSLQWDVEALSHRQYRVKEVWELYDRSCRSLDIEPLASFEKVLLSHIREERTLGSLDLTGSQINGTHMKCFADILDLNFGLVKLELSHCGIDDDAVRLLAYSLLCNDSVRYLSLANNPRVRSDGIRYISILVRHSKQLQLLDISGISIRKKSAGYLAAALAGLGSNWSLGRGSMHKKSTMCEQISLQALRMNSCGIKPASLAILASGVRLSPLQHLSLRLNSLNGSAGPILREMLYGDPPQLTQGQQRQQPPRRPISVSLHGLSDAQHHGDLAMLSATGDAPNDSPRVSRLRSLDLSQNDLGRAVMDLAEGLLWNTNLRSLVLRQNKLQPAMFASFMECLGINKGLAYLDISRNPVCGPSPVVLEVLSHVVSQNQTLKALFMSATNMTSEGAIMLAECLPELQCLERLDVSENPGIEVAGLMALSASVKLNKSLICVEISVNIGDDVCAALEQGIAQTCIANMQRLDISSIQSDESDFGFGLASAHVWSHADVAPESDIPGIVATKVSSENDRYECTSLVTDIAAVKRSTYAQECDDNDDNDDDIDGHSSIEHLDNVDDHCLPNGTSSYADADTSISLSSADCRNGSAVEQASATHLQIAFELLEP